LISFSKLIGLLLVSASFFQEPPDGLQCGIAGSSFYFFAMGADYLLQRRYDKKYKEFQEFLKKSK